MSNLRQVALLWMMAVASDSYRTDGFLVDLDLGGTVSSYDFLSGVTNYIATSIIVETVLPANMALQKHSPPLSTSNAEAEESRSGHIAFRQIFKRK